MPSSTISQNPNISHSTLPQGPGAAGKGGKHVPIPLGDSVTNLGGYALSSSCPGMGSKMYQEPRLSQSFDTSATGIGGMIGNQANEPIPELANAAPANGAQAVAQAAVPAVANQPPGVAVANRLADNFVTIAGEFSANNGVCKAITDDFSTQVDGLRKVLEGLKFNNLSDGRKSAVMRGLNTLMGFIQRYDTTALGGVYRGGFTLLEMTAIENGVLSILLGREKNSENIKSMKKQIADLKAQPESEENKKQIAELEDKLEFLNVAEEVLAKKVKNLDPEEFRNGAIKLLDLLKELTNLNPDTKDPQDKMMNVLQQFSFGSWLCNDIIPAFEGSGPGTPPEADPKPEDTNLLAGLVGGLKLTEFKELNEAARKTPMFSEVRLPAGEFPQYASGKFGLRGRSGCNAAGVPNTERRPLYNLTEEEKKKGGIDPLLKDRAGVNTQALETGFVPKPTARRNALPEDVVQAINNPGYNWEVMMFGQDMVEKGLLIKEGDTFKSAPSYAAIIDDAGFSTYCSVSGTTGELVCRFAKNPVTQGEGEEVLIGLMEVARGTREITDVQNLSRLFAPIAAFMEVGHFHTTAEVLGGFFSVACANDPEFQKLSAAEKREFMESGFKTLLSALKDHSECFLG